LNWKKSPMPQRILFALQKFHPGRLFAVLLASIFGVEAVVMLLLPRLLPQESSVNFTALVDAFLLTGMLAPLIWILVIRPLQRLAEMRHQLLALVLSAQEEERRRIARDLHDDLGQSLTSLLVGLRIIEEGTSEAATRQQAQELRRIGSDTHEEIRRLARGLRPAVLDDMGLQPALERFLEDLRSIQDIDAQLELESSSCPRLPGGFETALFRIVQEATANAIRHGGATELRLKLQCDPNEVRLTIRDNGRGFDPAKVMQQTNTDAPFGLTNIFERAWLCGGDVLLQSQLGKGATVEVRIPLPAIQE
jgi:signal transduction histidine kinase